MKKIALLLLITSIVTGLFGEQQKNEFIHKSLDFKKSLVLKELDFSNIEINGYSPEGGFLDKYTINSKTVYIDALLFFEMGKLNYRFYYTTDTDVYIEVDKWSYPEPFVSIGSTIEKRSFINVENKLYEIIDKETVLSDFKLLDISSIIK